MDCLPPLCHFIFSSFQMFSSESSQLDISSPFCFLHYLNMIHLRRTACDILGHAVTKRPGLAWSADSSLKAFIRLKKKNKQHCMLATCGIPIFSCDDQMNSSAACMAITSKEMLLFFPACISFHVHLILV